MNRSTRIALPALVATLALSGCARKNIQLGHSKEYAEDKLSPMPSEQAHAPAEIYRYFADAEVYHSDTRNLYFFRNEAGEWESDRNLPYYIEISNIFEYKSVALHVDDPTLFHQSFVSAFPADRNTEADHAHVEAIVTVTDIDAPGW